MMERAKKAIIAILLLAGLVASSGFQASYTILPQGSRGTKQGQLSGEILVGFVDNSYAPPGAEHLFGTVYLIRTKSTVSELASRPGVRFAEPNGTAELEIDPSWNSPNDEGFGRQWALHDYDEDYDIDYLEAWNVYHAPRNVVIAILDTGLDVNHRDAPNLWINEDEIPDNGIDDDHNGYVDDVHGANTAENRGVIDNHGHGTHVAGIAAAKTNNGVGMAGVYPNGPVMVVKVFPGSRGSTTWDAVIKGIVYAADNGAQIISMSLGGREPSQALREAVQYAWDKGCLVIAAAGNSGGLGEGLKYPAAYPEVIAVGATNSVDHRASFSSYGKGLEIMAPGVFIWSLSPHNGYREASGTSVATPHVAGVAALIWTTFPEITNQQVRDRLIQAADDLGPPGWDKETGWGRVNAFRAISTRDDNLVRDPSFEGGLAQWRAVGDARVVRGGFRSKQALKLANTPQKAAKASQRIKVKGKSGDTIVASAYSNYGLFLQGKYPLRVKIIYNDGTKEQGTAWFRRRGDQEGWVYAEVSIKAKKRYKAVVITLVNRGKWKMPVKFDEITLYVRDKD